jgi:hypothetical protein
LASFVSMIISFLQYFIQVWCPWFPYIIHFEFYYACTVSWISDPWLSRRFLQWCYWWVTAIFCTLSLHWDLWYISYVVFFLSLLLISAAATFACRPCELHSIQGALSIYIAFRIWTQMQLSYIFFGGGEMEGRDYFKSLL